MMFPQLHKLQTSLLLLGDWLVGDTGHYSQVDCADTSHLMKQSDNALLFSHCPTLLPWVLTLHAIVCHIYLISIFSTSLNPTADTYCTSRPHLLLLIPFSFAPLLHCSWLPLHFFQGLILPKDSFFPQLLLTRPCLGKPLPWSLTTPFSGTFWQSWASLTKLLFSHEMF